MGVLFVIFILRGIVDYCPFGSRWGAMAMIFSIYLHKCMKNANNATNKQTNKQSDNKQSANALSGICASSIPHLWGNACIMHDGACTEFKIEKQIQNGSAVCGKEEQEEEREPV